MYPHFFDWRKETAVPAKETPFTPLRCSRNCCPLFRGQNPPLKEWRFRFSTVAVQAGNGFLYSFVARLILMPSRRDSLPCLKGGGPRSGGGILLKDSRRVRLLLEEKLSAQLTDEVLYKIFLLRGDIYINRRAGFPSRGAVIKSYLL